MNYPEKFFQIEKIRSNFKFGMFKGNLEDLLSLRENNRKQNKFLNSGFPYYPEEKNLMIKMHSEKTSISQIIDYFQRPESSIRNILSIQISTNIKEVEKVSRSNLFFQAILNGADPITGEVLTNESVWRHPKIISDIKSFLDERNYKNNDTKYKSYWTLVDIKNWVKTNDELLDIVLIQQGYYFAVIEEDAVFCSNKFDLKVYRVHETSILQTGFPVTSIEKYESLFKKRNIKYAIVEQTGRKHSNGRMIRKVTFPLLPGQESKEF
tara:strand:+ start:215 stop:1012 length:798 start_codon:yes stop_codon:yes gene_type:complete